MCSNDFKTHGKRIQKIALMILVLAVATGTQAWGNITPTDVYYLAKSVDASLVSMYGLQFRADQETDQQQSQAKKCGGSCTCSGEIKSLYDRQLCRQPTFPGPDSVSADQSREPLTYLRSWPDMIGKGPQADNVLTEITDCY